MSKQRDFKEWFDAVWLGDGEQGEYVPTNRKDPDYDKYMEQYTLAHGAWIAGREALAEPEQEQEPVATVKGRIAFDGRWVLAEGAKVKAGDKLYARPAPTNQQAGDTDGLSNKYIVVQSSPKQIWLDLGFDPDIEGDDQFSALDDVTWSNDNASGYGIAYIRADLLAPAPEAPAPRSECSWCEDCDVKANNGMRSRMSLCPECGNKRCPRAKNHANTCTGSNEVGQKGSSWENVKPNAAQAPAPAPEQTESVLIEGRAYTVPAAVAAELLRLHLELMQAPAWQELSKEEMTELLALHEGTLLDLLADHAAALRAKNIKE